MIVHIIIRVCACVVTSIYSWRKRVTLLYGSWHERNTHTNDRMNLQLQIDISICVLCVVSCTFFIYVRTHIRKAHGTDRVRYMCVYAYLR